MTIEAIFSAANIFVLPFWTLIIFLPNWGVTRKVMESYLPFAFLACVYLYLLVGEINTETAQALANPKLADIARFFSEEGAAATGWLHFLVMDLFVGRWIYWEGQKTGVWTAHSIALSLFAGPFGLLSHILTAAIARQFFSSAETETPPPAPTS